MPAVLLALYFTYSRGGLLALLVACGCLIALSHDRLWLLATLAIGAIGALPAVLAVQARDSLADNLDNAAAVDQGVTVLLILLAGIAAGARCSSPGCGGWSARRGGAHRAGAGALPRPAAAEADRGWSRRGARDRRRGRGRRPRLGPVLELRRRSSRTSPQQHFGELSGAGRHDFWRVAIDAFDEKPVLGHGAGTYQFSWDEAALDRHARPRRPLALPGGLRRARG